MVSPAEMCVDEVGVFVQVTCEWQPDFSVKVSGVLELHEAGGGSCGGNEQHDELTFQRVVPMNASVPAGPWPDSAKRGTLLRPSPRLQRPRDFPRCCRQPNRNVVGAEWPHGFPIPQARSRRGLGCDGSSNARAAVGVRFQRRREAGGRSPLPKPSSAVSMSRGSTIA
jgi:hypothetical protein